MNFKIFIYNFTFDYLTFYVSFLFVAAETFPSKRKHTTHISMLIMQRRPNFHIQTMVVWIEKNKSFPRMWTVINLSSMHTHLLQSDRLNVGRTNNGKLKKRVYHKRTARQASKAISRLRLSLIGSHTTFLLLHLPFQ